MQEGVENSSSRIEVVARTALLATASFFPSSLSASENSANGALEPPAAYSEMSLPNLQQIEDLELQDLSAKNQLPLDELQDSGRAMREVAIEPPSIGTTEESVTYGELLLSALGAASSLTAMGWYYQQLRRKETAVNLTTLSLGAANDLLLCGAALLTGQGLIAAATTGAFSVGALLCIAEVWKNHREAIKFSNVDKLCAAITVPGLLLLAASRIPAVAEVVAPEVLTTIGSVLGVAVNGIIIAPLARTLLSPVAANEKLLDTQNGKVWAMAKPMLPYAVGTFGLGLSIFGVPAISFAQLFQPSALFATNLVLTGLLLVWSSRRLKEDTLHSS